MEIDKAIKLAIENVKKEGLTDIFPRPDEIDSLKNESFCKHLARQVKSRLQLNTLPGLKIHSIQHVLFPKKNPFDFRRAALMQPVDTIVFLSMVLQIADLIESKRPAPGKNCIFSYRLKPKDGLLFNPKYNYTSFEKHVRSVAKKPRTKVLIKCDVANFYDRLNLHRLESALLGHNANKNIVKQINELLLFWANRDSYGLPIGGNASRILAEAFLLPIDDYLISHDVKFCRFVDDYRFFAPNIESAHTWLTMFVERLFLEGLAVNPSKTFLEDASQINKPFTQDSNEAEKDTPKGKRTSKIARIVVGYSGTIPTKFRELSEKEIHDLRKLNIDSIIFEINKKTVVDPDEARHLFRVLVATEKYELLPEMVLNISKRFPQFTPMIIDLLIKKKTEISEDDRLKIRNLFIEKIQHALPEYILVSIVRLLGTEGYQAKETLMEVLRNLKRNSGAFIGRCIMDALQGIATRNDVLEIRQLFDRADSWERRAIIRLVDKHLPDDEKRPWMKNMKVHMVDDLFAIESIEPQK